MAENYRLQKPHGRRAVQDNVVLNTSDGLAERQQATGCESSIVNCRRSLLARPIHRRAGIRWRM